MEAEPGQLHAVFAVEPSCRVVVVLGGDLGDQAYLVRAGPCPAVAPRHGRPNQVLRGQSADRFAQMTGFLPDFTRRACPEKTLPAERTDRLLPPVSKAPTTERRQGGQVAIMPDFDWPSGGARSSWPFTERSALMEYSQRNAGFPGRNAAFPGLSDGGTQRQSSEQPTAAPGTGRGQFSWSGVVPPQLEEIEMRENGFVLALWGGIGVAVGALLPFIYNVQETVYGSPFATGSVISAGDR